jgi:hypothetical protein
MRAFTPPFDHQAGAPCAVSIGVTNSAWKSSARDGRVRRSHAQPNATVAAERRMRDRRTVGVFMAIVVV